MVAVPSVSGVNSCPLTSKLGFPSGLIVRLALTILRFMPLLLATFEEVKMGLLPALRLLHPTALLGVAEITSSPGELCIRIPSTYNELMVAPLNWKTLSRLPGAESGK